MASVLSILSPVQAAGLALLLVGLAYLYRQLYHLRFQQNAHFPQFPTSLVWGHMKIMDEFTKRGPLDRHPDATFADMHQELGRPPVFILDFWPFQTPMVIVCSHEVAEQLTKSSKDFPYSVPKAASIASALPLMGSKSLLTKQNEDWKGVRKRFNPGFAPNHLMTLIPCILDKAGLFLDVMDSFVKTGEVFPLDLHLTNLTFDVIGAVMMGEDLDAQQTESSRQGQLIRLYKELLETFAGDILPGPPWLVPRLTWKRRKIGAQISEVLSGIVRHKFKELKSGSFPPGSTILDLSLLDVEVLTPELLEETCDQLKTFLFAGHDTTSSLLSWAFYEFSRTPRVLNAVKEEVERLFGKGASSDPQIIREKLLAPGGEDLARRMTYITAVTKEILRLHPPAGSVRMSKPGTNFVVSTPQGDYLTDGNFMYINHAILQRDREVFGDTADDFVPERWLGPGSVDGPESSKVPPSAWRPFERGPRACIGLELANIEARIIIALAAGRYDFVKVGLGELQQDADGQHILNDKGQFEVKTEVYPTIQVTSKPVDKMMMKVKAASRD